ncbi:MAG TPA: VWA domain-containing protein, partial [Promineifilum sp.]
MSLLVPIALGLGFLALPIIALYMMRLRRRELPISSTFLWRKLALDRTANAPWQKLRANLLLLLQLLILAALVLSLARLALLTPGRIGGDLVVLVDASASMLATDGNGGATRFEEAIAEAAGLIDQLSGDERMTLIQAGPRPAVLAAATADKKQLRDALETASAELSAADWQATIALASGSARSMSDPRFVLISDGGLPERLPALPGNVTFLPVGSSDENVSISALDVREAEDGKELFAGISNQGSSTTRVFVSLTVDG